jgi:hypothetical protein
MSANPPIVGIRHPGVTVERRAVLRLDMSQRSATALVKLIKRLQREDMELEDLSSQLQDAGIDFSDTEILK